MTLLWGRIWIASESLLEGLFRCQRIEQRHPMIATKRDEVEAALVLIADWFDVHSCRL